MKAGYSIKATLVAAVMFTMFAFGGVSGAETLGPGMYNMDNPAFGSANEDIPPDIVSVTISPSEPKAGEPLSVITRVTIDKGMTSSRVETAWAMISLDGGKTWSRTALEQSGSDPEIWSGIIFRQAPAGKVMVAVGATETMGNNALEVPPVAVSAWPPAPEDMVLISNDGPDALSYYSKSTDIISMRLTADADNFIARIEYGDKISPSTKSKFAHIYGMGWACPDIRLQPREVNHELNKSRMAGYIPLMNRKGIYTDIEALGGDPSAPVDLINQGNVMYIRVKRSDAAAPGMLEKGAKFWAATAMADISDPNMPEPIDFSNYSLVYFRSHEVEVK